jgi:23S rRNA (guanine745-N1)-methyltransferase
MAIKKKTMLTIEALKDIKEILICPICREELNVYENSVRCLNNHTFNISKQGELFLLNTSHFKPSAIYDKELFQNRRDFVRGRFYENVYSEIIKNIKNQSSEKDLIILDIGCGEGMHDEFVSQNLDIKHKFIGIDNSKDAINMATDFTSDNLLFMVADVTNLPLKDKSVDVVVDILSPFNESEINRVLSNNGVFIKVSPKEQYLAELRNAFGIPIYENEEKVSNNIMKKFSVLSKIEIHEKFDITKDQLRNLVKMNPLTKPLNGEESHDISQITISLNVFVQGIVG